MRRAAVLGMTLALVGPGCRTDDGAGPAERARGAAEAFLESCAAGQVVPAELSLTEPQRAVFVRAGAELEGCLEVTGLELPGTPGPEAVRALFRDAGTAAVRTGGGFAEVVVEARGTRRTLELESVRGLWLISGSTAAPAA